MRLGNALLWCSAIGLAGHLLAESTVDRGKAVFAQCSGCHSTQANEKKVGPSLHGLLHKKQMANHQKPSPKNVMAVIEHGANGMPGYATTLNAKQKSDLMSFLKTL